MQPAQTMDAALYYAADPEKRRERAGEFSLAARVPAHESGIRGVLQEARAMSNETGIVPKLKPELQP